MYISKHIVRFSSFILLLSGVTSCAYIIPEDLNAPRNNEVIGERHVPERNVGKTTTKKSGAPQAAVAPASAPVASVEPSQPTKQALAQPTTQPRLAPLENRQFQLSAAGYPTLSDTPPRPVTTGPDSAPARLNETKTTLEHDRAAADGAAAALSRDAATEPSMLSDLPKADGSMPAQEPANGPAKQPTSQPEVNAPAAALPQNAQPSAPATKPQASSGAMVLPPPPILYPVEPVTYSPKTAAVAVPKEPASVASAPQQLASAAPFSPMPIVKPGDFDPLTVADAAPSLTPTPDSQSSNASRYGIPSRYYNQQ